MWFVIMDNFIFTWCFPCSIVLSGVTFFVCLLDLIMLNYQIYTVVPDVETVNFLWDLSFAVLHKATLHTSHLNIVFPTTHNAQCAFFAFVFDSTCSNSSFSVRHSSCRFFLFVNPLYRCFLGNLSCSMCSHNVSGFHVISVLSQHLDDIVVQLLFYYNLPSKHFEVGIRWALN